MDRHVAYCAAGAGIAALVLGAAIPSPVRLTPKAAHPLAASQDEARKRASGQGEDTIEASCAGGFVAPVTALNSPLCVKPGSGQSFRDCPDCPEMAAVPSGAFAMGSPESEAGRYPNEGPLHAVTIAKPFAVSRYSITVAEYLACIK